MNKKYQPRLKEVLGYNGLPYSDYNRHRQNRRDIWFFHVEYCTSGDDYFIGYRSYCNLDEYVNTRVEHSAIMGDATINLLAQWLQEN